MKHLMKRAWTKYALAAVVTAMIVAPTAAIAGHNFSDVPSTHLFHGDIEWMLDNGITTGCGAARYCPESNVTRGQMAAFMKRLSTSKVVDAKTAVTAETATTATNATKLGAKAPVNYRTVLASSSTDVFAGTTIGDVTTFALIDSVSITVPAAGAIRLDASSTYNVAAGAESAVTWLEHNAGTPCDSGVNSAGGSPDYIQGSLGAGSTVDEFFDASSSVAVSVAAAGTHTFSLCSEAWAGTPTVMGSNMHAQWIPADSATIAALAGQSATGSVGE